VGGTWYWNRYPGARCDSESHAYRFSFSEDLAREWQWSERYPGQAEVLRYLNFVADRLDLKRDIRFNTRVKTARWDEGAALWQVTTESGESHRARFLITAVGCLSSANIPDIPGLESFAGQWYHTGSWPHEGVDFHGKRVGQVGTGSTGIQCAPVIAETAAHLTVFQRTANYSVPARNAPLTDEFKRYAQDNVAEINQAMRATRNGHPFFDSDRAALATPPEEREALYEEAWAKGGLQFRATFRDIISSVEANSTAAEFIRAKIRATVKDPATAARLANIDHPYAAKRPPIDTNYFETFNRDNVALVDLRAEPIERITSRGIRTASAEYPLDVIVFATGFDGMTGSLLAMDIRGRDDTPLGRAWSEGPRNYLGLQVAGFPNMFMITGPGSPSVLCNMPVPIEQHVEWITDCIACMREKGVKRIETGAAAMDAWVAKVNDAAAATLLPMATHSWYLGANIPGKPRVFMPYAGGMARYREICDQVAANNYEGFTFSD
jgi:cation diffusion facilitator CzcD-associated flavoprotein CzcO